MKHKLPPLDRFKVFESAARHLSFSKAADELCITKSAVSYQIQKLEQSLAYPLFKRSVRQVFLTDAGQKLYQLIKTVFTDLDVGLKRLKTTSSNELVIGATTYVAARWLSPRVAKFLQQYPEVSVVFRHEMNSERTLFEEVDLSVVWGVCDPKALTLDSNQIRQIPMSLFPACSPELAKKVRSDIPYLKKIPLLSENRQPDLWLEWFKTDQLENPRQLIEDANVRVQAAIAGQGLIMADSMMKAELDAGVLVRLLDKELVGYGYILNENSRHEQNEATLRMVKWLQQ